jgi:short-subunit dehydrogenase
VTYVALITGASSGIGEATARRLAREPEVRLILVARREDQLLRISREIGRDDTIVIAADLTDPTTPTLIAQTVEREHGALNLLVNNAGARWSIDFADGGWANVEQHLRVNFEAPVRLIEALLPLMRRTAAGGGAVAGRAGGSESTTTVFAGAPLKAPVSIVNVTSTAARIARRGTGGYNAAKFALSGWSDSLYLEERIHGVHVGNVLPGFIMTEGFPQAELVASWRTRWLVSDVEGVADAILQAGPGGRSEVYQPRWYWFGAALRLLATKLIRRAGASDVVATSTNSV